MRNRSNKTKASSNNSKVDTLVGHETEVVGDIRFAGGLHIDGVVKGNVAADPASESALAIISERGRVEGELRVPRLIVNGHVTGDVYATERLDLAKDARVFGDVHYRTMEMASGAEINGQLVRIEQEAQGLIEHYERNRSDGGESPQTAGAEAADDAADGPVGGVAADGAEADEKT